MLSYSNRNSSVVLVLNQINSNTQRGGSRAEDTGIKRIFLSKLFELIGTMCECSGDFFADRFRNDVWPVMARHLEHLLTQLQRQRDAQTLSGNAMSQEITHVTLSRRHRLPLSLSAKNENSTLPLSMKTRPSFEIGDTERQLILSILKCLDRVLQQKECGKAVATLLGSIGFTLLPLLDIKEQAKIQDLAMDCIRNIILIDCDVLKRPLLELSGIRVPSCPLKFGIDRHNPWEKTALQENSDDNCSPSRFGGINTIIDRCHELLAFADTLPEQSIS